MILYRKIYTATGTVTQIQIAVKKIMKFITILYPRRIILKSQGRLESLL